MNRAMISCLIGNKLTVDRPTLDEILEHGFVKIPLVLRHKGKIAAIIDDDYFFDRDGNRFDFDV